MYKIIVLLSALLFNTGSAASPALLSENDIKQMNPDVKDNAFGQSGPASGDRFKPDLSRVWKSTYGDVHWQQRWYGSENKTISVQAEFWDPVRNIYVLKGEWGRKNDPDYKGGFEFEFMEPCSFSGVWWYTQSENKTGWKGNCK